MVDEQVAQISDHQLISITTESETVMLGPWLVPKVALQMVTWLCGRLRQDRWHKGCTCSALNCRQCPGPQTADEAKRQKTKQHFKPKSINKKLCSTDKESQTNKQTNHLPKQILMESEDVHTR